MDSKLRKKMSKAVRNASSGVVVPPRKRPADPTATKELLKSYGRAPAPQKKGLLETLKIKFGFAKAKKKKVSKRTATGTVPSDSSPASPHREGKRWIKNLLKQTLANRTVDAHRGRKK
jgi:hypothetical protein